MKEKNEMMGKMPSSTYETTATGSHRATHSTGRWPGAPRRTLRQAGRHRAAAARRVPNQALGGQVQPLVLAIVVQHLVAPPLAAPGQHLAAVHARRACARQGVQGLQCRG